MSSSPLPDPLVTLWQTAARPDTRRVLQDLQRLKRMHRRLQRIVLAILVIVSILLILAEAIGRIATHGILSVIWILALAIGIAWQRRSQCNRIDALALDTVSLLKFMLARVNKDLFIARCLYAGVPCGALAGFFIVKITGNGRAPAAIAVHPQLDLILTGAGVVLLIAMVASGIILARSRRLQLKALREKLRSLEAGL
jgi:hypothetical protein